MGQARQTWHFARSAKRVRSARRGEEIIFLLSSSRDLPLVSRFAQNGRVRLAWPIKRLLCKRINRKLFTRVTRSSSLGLSASKCLHLMKCTLRSPWRKDWKIAMKLPENRLRMRFAHQNHCQVHNVHCLSHYLVMCYTSRRVNRLMILTRETNSL